VEKATQITPTDLPSGATGSILAAMTTTTAPIIIPPNPDPWDDDDNDDWQPPQDDDEADADINLPANPQPTNAPR
jgi:hypothetical protein